MVKVVGTYLMDLEEARGYLIVAVESHINLLFNLTPPLSQIPSRRDYVTISPKCWR